MKKITEYAISELGAYNTGGRWFPTEQAAQDVINEHPKPEMFHVITITYDDPEQLLIGNIEAKYAKLLSGADEVRAVELDTEKQIELIRARGRIKAQNARDDQLEVDAQREAEALAEKKLLQEQDAAAQTAKPANELENS